MLIGAAAVLALLTLLARWRRAPFLFYAAGFALVWGFVLKSGLDTALAGIACAFTVPIGTRRLGQDSMLRYFMESLHGYVAFAVRPLFVFTVVGVAYRDLRLADLGQAAPLGVMLALRGRQAARRLHRLRRGDRAEASRGGRPGRNGSRCWAWRCSAAPAGRSAFTSPAWPGTRQRLCGRRS